MKNKRPRPCPACLSLNVEMEEKTYDGVIGMGALYQCTIKCTACGYRIPRISDESAEHARHAAVESWNKERVC